MTPKLVPVYQHRPMWRRAKFVLPMAGMLLVTGLVGVAMAVIVSSPDSAATVSSMIPAVAMSIAGMAGIGTAGVAVHDTMRDRSA